MIDLFLLQGYGRNLILNYPVGEPTAVVIGLAVLLFLPLVALLHCLFNRDLYGMGRFLWFLFIVATWPLLSLGAVLYGVFLFHSKLLKLMVAGGALTLVVTVWLSWNYIAQGNNMLVGAAERAVERQVIDPVQKDALLRDTGLLQREVAENPAGSRRHEIAQTLAIYLAVLAEQDMTPQEYKDWRGLFDYRDRIDPVKFRSFLNVKLDAGKD